MKFYWCRIAFDKNGKVAERIILFRWDSEQEMIANIWNLISHERGSLYSFMFPHPFHWFDKNWKENALNWLYRRNNLEDRYRGERESFRQLIREDGEGVKTPFEIIADFRWWHERFLQERASAHSGFEKGEKEQEWGRAHKKNCEFHWQAHIIQTLQLISQDMMRPKTGSKFRGGLDFDPKRSDSENNWKQAKVRHQWEWHLKKHQDTFMPVCDDAPEDMTDDMPRTLFDAEMEKLAV